MTKPVLTADPVVIVEDNDFVRMQVAAILDAEGYAVSEYAEGTTALDFIKKNPFCVAIVDVRMEPMDGFEFIRAVKGLGLDNPVVLMTGDNNPDLLAQSGELQVNAMLTKPVEKDRLLKTVERLIGVYQKRKAS